jgi:periplasmic protein TonB
MNNYYLMTAEFERQKNIKASAITFGVAVVLLLIMLFYKWPLPTIPPVPLQEFIEVDLGNGDPGSGTDHPLLPGEPAPAQQQAYNPPQPVQSTVSDAKDIETDDRAENVAPEIRRPTVSNPTSTKIDNNNKVVKSSPTTQPAVTQAPPRPRAVLGRTVGGNGNGGNGADTYSPGTGGPGGTGNGNGGSGGGTGTGTGPRHLGTQIVSIPSQSFEDDFTQSGKIALEILVNANGVLQSAVYSSKGSTLPKSSVNTSIALRRARELKYPKMEGGFRKTQIFEFTVR